MERITVFKLHELIQSLKKEEKRSFKLFVKRYNNKEDSPYLRLFDYLAKEPTIDRKKVKEQFKTVKGLSAVQTYLYQQILRSLRNQTSYRNIDLSLLEGLAELEILYTKQLLHSAKEKLEEMEHLAMQHDKLFFLPFLYEWWFKLENTRLSYHDVEEPTFEAYKGKYQQSAEILQQYIRYRTQLSLLVFAIKGKYSRQFFSIGQQIMSEIGAYQPSEPHSFMLNMANLQLRAFLGAILRNTEYARYHHELLYELTDDLPPTVKENYYRVHFNALAGMTINAVSKEKILAGLRLVDSIEENQQKYLTDNLRHSIMSTKIRLYLVTEQYEDCLTYIESINLEARKIYLGDSMYSFFYYQFALCYYGLRDYTQALNMLDHFLLDKERSELRAHSYGWLLKLIIYFEQGEYLLLSSFLNNVKRNFKRKGTLFEFEKLLIAFINKLIQVPEAEQQAQWIKFKAQLSEFIVALEPHQKEFLVYFNYEDWVESHAAQQPFKLLQYWTVNKKYLDEV